MSANKRVSLSIKQKVSILNEIKHCTKQEISKKYGCSTDTINRILRNKTSILQSSKICSNLSRKRDRVGKSKKVDQAVAKWFDQMRLSGAVVTSNMIMEKAKQFAIALKEEFEPSLGWLYRWQRREGISIRKIHGESSSADHVGAANFQEILPSLIADYSSKDIFNADETGLIYKALSSSTLNRKNFKISGSKSPKDRITILLLCNATGDYKKMFAIGKPKNPRCFKNREIPMKYFSQHKSWMTQDIWREIMLAFDEEMIQQNRKVILFVDNASAHKQVQLKNVDVRYLPANTTCILQPLDQGIIHAFKPYYRQNIIRKQICFSEAGKNIEDFKKSISILTALHIAKRAFWMVTPDTIVNCFKKCKFAPQSLHPPDVEDQEDEIIIIQYNPENASNFENFVDFDNDLPCYVQPNDDEIISELQSSEDDSDDDVDDSDEYIPVPSVSSALNSLSNLRGFLLSKNGIGKN